VPTFSGGDGKKNHFLMISRARHKLQTHVRYVKTGMGLYYFFKKYLKMPTLPGIGEKLARRQNF